MTDSEPVAHPVKENDRLTDTRKETMTVHELQTQPPEPSREERFEHLDHELNALLFAINACDNFVTEADDDDWPVDVLAHWLQTARDHARQLAIVNSALERLVGDKMSGYQQTVEGVGTLERHKNTSYTKWDTDALLHDVLDTRLIDANTGEVIDESPLDKVLAVWNLPAPRRTVLKSRGLQADEYAQVEDKGGFKVVIK